MSLDINLFNFINQYAGRNVYVDGLAIFFAEYLQYMLATVVLLLLIFNFKKYLSLVLKIGLAVILSRGIITELIRFLWERSRPFIENNVNLLIEHSPSASFPSGHASFFFAIATVIYLHNKKAGLIFFVASFLIAFSRVFAGIHWPADIVVGALVGMFSGWLVIKLFKKS